MDDFGGKLRQARERRGISLRQIAASTKISAAALEALERNDISKLPGGIFSRAFVRSYAVEVGLDPEETVREFLERFNQEAPPSAEVLVAEIPEQERTYHEQQRRAARTLTIAGVALVVLVVGAFFFLRNRGKHPPPAAEVATLPDSPPLPPAPVTPPPATLSPPAAETRPGATVAPAASVTLDIHPTSECWVSLTVDGKKLFARVIPAGQKETVAIATDATIEVGDAGSFAYFINGKPGRPLGSKGQVRALKLTPANASQYTR